MDIKKRCNMKDQYLSMRRERIKIIFNVNESYNALRHIIRNDLLYSTCNPRFLHEETSATADFFISNSGVINNF